MAGQWLGQKYRSVKVVFHHSFPTIRFPRNVGIGGPGFSGPLGTSSPGQVELNLQMSSIEPKTLCIAGQGNSSIRMSPFLYWRIHAPTAACRPRPITQTRLLPEQGQFPRASSTNDAWHLPVFPRCIPPPGLDNTSPYGIFLFFRVQNPFVKLRYKTALTVTEGSQ
jgi:hypothetical protein